MTMMAIEGRRFSMRTVRILNGYFHDDDRDDDADDDHHRRMTSKGFLRPSASQRGANAHACAGTSH